MKSKQDILNAFREKFVVTKPDYRDPSLGFWKLDENGTYYRPEHVESWLLTTLTEFEREMEKKFYIAFKENWEEKELKRVMKRFKELQKDLHPSK